MPTRTKFQGWEPQTFREWEAEMQEREDEALRRFYQREHRPLKVNWSFVAVWAGLLAVCGFAWGFFFYVIGPLIHRLLAKVGW